MSTISPGCGRLHGLGYPDNIIPVERQGSRGNQPGCTAQLPGAKARLAGRAGSTKGGHLEAATSLGGVPPSAKGNTGPAVLGQHVLLQVQ